MFEEIIEDPQSETIDGISFRTHTKTEFENINATYTKRDFPFSSCIVYGIVERPNLGLIPFES